MKSDCCERTSPIDRGSRPAWCCQRYNLLRDGYKRAKKISKEESRLNNNSKSIYQITFRPSCNRCCTRRSQMQRNCVIRQKKIHSRELSCWLNCVEECNLISVSVKYWWNSNQIISIGNVWNLSLLAEFKKQNRLKYEKNINNLKQMKKKHNWNDRSNHKLEK